MLKLNKGIALFLAVFMGYIIHDTVQPGKGRAEEIAIPSFASLEFNTATLDMPGTVTVAGGGALQVSTGTITVSNNGAWSNAGVFDAGGGMVEFTGASHAVNGSSTFYNLKCNVAGGQLSFEAGKTQTIRNALTLKGASGSGNYLSLKSSASGTQWNLCPQGTTDVNYIDAKDCNNIGISRIIPASWTDGGNNTQWGPAPSDGGGGGGGVTTTYYVAVSSTSPSSGATGVAANAAISATFSDTMSGLTLTTDTFRVTQGGNTVGGSVSTGGATATFTPSSNLSYNTTYTVTITTGAKAANAAQSTLSADYSWSFTTTSAPVVPTPASTATPTPVPSPASTATPTATSTPVVVATATPPATPVSTTTPSSTPSPVTSPTATPKPTPTMTPVATPSPTATATPTPEPTPSPSPTATPSGSLSLSKEVAYLSGDTVVATVVDSGRNTRSGAEDVLTTALKVKGENYYSGADLVLDLKENGVNSGTFLATIRTGTATSGGASSGVRSNIGTMKTVQGGTATVVYTGATPNAATVTRLLSFSSSDATLEFDADVYTIGSYAVITHTDAEENEDAEQVDTLLDHAYIKTSSFNQAKVKLVETGVDTGTFKGSIQISSRATLDYERIQASIGGTLTVWCEDGINTTGALRTVSARSRVVDGAIPMPTPAVTPTPTVTPVVTPTIQPTPTPEVTPSPVVCEVEKIKPSPSKLSRLKRNTSDEVTVTVTGKNGCLVAGETVTASVSTGKGLISLSSESQETDENGKAVFTVTAGKKKGQATITFKAGGKKKTMVVRIKK